MMNNFMIIIKNILNSRNLRITFFIFIFTVALSFNSKIALANNLIVNDFEVYELDESANTITFQCNIAWENSWRSITNYDAVWVFLKYSTDGGATWSHASMAGSGSNPNGFSVPSTFEIIVPQDEKGFFIQRADLGNGNVEAENVRFVWDYAQDGLTDEQSMASNTINKIFGIEMVYAPQGSFYAGDGASSSNYRFVEGSSDTDPWYIQNESAFSTTGSASDGFYYKSSGASNESSSGSVFLLPTSFPKGFRAFYQMKYELTEGQWVGFFNTLSPTEKSNRDITSAVEGGKNSDSIVNRNTISWDSNSPKLSASTTRPDRPVTYVSWPDVLAYADWAALRPMTELEYEKSARGLDVSPKTDEFSWGTSSSNDVLASEIYPDAEEDGTEQIFDGSANLNRNNLSWSSGDGRVGGIAEGQKGPLRAGIFAESSTNRVTSGSGYYGAKELSGNLSEMVVTIGRPEGRQFLGSHGDGELSRVSGYEGYATNTDWPGINGTDSARGVTGTVGSGYRGGDFNASNIRYFQLSDRSLAAKDADSTGKSQRYDSSAGVFGGGRFVRTAP